MSGRFSQDSRYGACDHGPRRSGGQAGESRPADLLESAPIPFDQMCADLGELIATVPQPHLRELLDACSARAPETGTRWRVAPAAKVYHQAYRHGLSSARCRSLRA